MSHITATEIGTWLANATAGEAITYFRGFLALATGEENGSRAEADRFELVRASGYLWKAAQHGRVHLVQIRHGVGDYTYLAIARGCRGEGRRTTAPSGAGTVEPPS